MNNKKQLYAAQQQERKEQAFFTQIAAKQLIVQPQRKKIKNQDRGEDDEVYDQHLHEWHTLPRKRDYGAQNPRDSS